MNSTWKEKWIEDIEFLEDNLIKGHRDLFFKISKVVFQNKTSNLKKLINELDYEEMKIELSKIVAAVGDAHTAIYFPVEKFIPCEFYWFDEGIYVVKTTKEYNYIKLKKLISIEGINVYEVLDELSKIISHENIYFFKAQSMKYMQVAEVLYGSLICDSTNHITLGFEDGEVKVETVNKDGLIYDEDKRLPYYICSNKENFYYEFLNEDNEIIIYYNSCREEGSISIEEKIKNAIEFINNNRVKTITIDLSCNLGGDSRLITPFIDFIKNNKKLNRKESLRIKIGRETFSSALLNAYEFKSQTNATLIGEPTGGKPNCYGEVERFVLPNSKFVVSYSTKYYKLVEDDSILALYPDVKIIRSINDCIN